MKKKITIIGGLGIENRTLVSQNKTYKYRTVGGSAWFSGITAVALSYGAEIISRLGSDDNAILIKEMLQQKRIHFLGNCEGATQEFSSKIINGEPQSYIAKNPNQTIDQFLDISARVTFSNIVIVTFNEIEFYTSVPEETKKTLSQPFLVANPSGAIFEMGEQFDRLVCGYDLVTMNIKEANYLMELYRCSVDKLLLEVMKYNRYIIITSKNCILYANNGLIHKYLFTPATSSIKDATGAGDAFAVAVAISLSNDIPIDEAIAKAVIVSQNMCNVLNKVEIKPNQWEVFL